VFESFARMTLAEPPVSWLVPYIQITSSGLGWLRAVIRCMYRNMGYVVPGFICMWGKIWFEDKPPRQDSGDGNTVRRNLSIDTSPRECSIKPVYLQAYATGELEYIY
jgi:hypothetical protein